MADVIDRIRKLMALTADRGASEAEAALAAEHVQRLLAEHNLSMASVEASGSSTGAGGKRTREGVNTRQVYKWQRDLMGAVAELNFCKAFTKWESRGWGRSQVFNGYDLIGRVDNVTTTKVMFEYLQQTIERLAREDVGDPTQYFTKYAHSFKHGCADRVVDRLRDEQRRIVREQEQKAKEQAARNQHPGAAPSNAVVVYMSDMMQAERDYNNDFENGWELGTTARKRTEGEARYAAQEAKRQAIYDAAKAAGHSDDVAHYMSYGYSLERAIELATPKIEKPETDAQRRKREEREYNQRQRWYDQQDRAARKFDREGFRKGQQAGNDVSLNRQVDEAQQRKLS